MIARACALLAVGAAWTSFASAEDFSAQEVYRRAASSVVFVYAPIGEDAAATGTGSLIRRDGLVLTNHHVIADEQGRLRDLVLVFFKPDRITGDLQRDLTVGAEARVLAHDAELDVAVLRVEEVPASVDPLRFGDSERVSIGQPVAAIGHPGGGGLWTLTAGTISSARRYEQRDVFQTDAAINPGNSGGPLLDGAGNLVGVNTFIHRVGGAGLPLEGLNYSIRSVQVRRWLAGQGVEVETASAGGGASSPRAAAPKDPPRSAPPSASRREERAFEGPKGETMYGVPDRDFSHRAVQREIFDRARRRADEAFDELDGL